MVIEPKFVFECKVAYLPYEQRVIMPNGGIFDTAQELCSFIEKIDWTAPRYLSRRPVGIMDFRLGTQFQFQMGAHAAASNVQWGPRFLVGTAVRDGMVLAPADMEYNPETEMIGRGYAWQSVDLSEYDAVISPKMAQVWPAVNPQRSVLQRFLDFAATQRFEIHDLSKTRGGR